MADFPAIVGQVSGALLAIPDAVTRVVSSVRAFTDALNPQVGLNFDRALRSLEATIGQALEPIVVAATAIIVQFAGALTDAMAALRGPIETVSGLIVSVLQPVFAAVADVAGVVARNFEHTLPLLRNLAVVLEGALSVAGVMVTVFFELDSAIRDVLLGTLGDLGKVTSWLKDQFVEMGKAFIVGTVVFLRMVGANALALRVLEALAREPKKAGITPAPSEYRLGGLADIYQRRLVEAAKGGGKTVADEQLDVMKELRDFAKEQIEILKDEQKAAAQDRAARQGWAAGGGAGLPFLNIFGRWGAGGRADAQPLPEGI